MNEGAAISAIKKITSVINLVTNLIMRTSSCLPCQRSLQPQV
jgi:hypothetical protein